MNVAMMQPTFMSWQGYFELIYKSDIFVFLDDFQFSVQSYHQRNRLFINKGEVGWYTVPVQKSNSFKAPLNKTLINESTRWREKMIKRIQVNYSRAPFYSEIAPYIKKWLSVQTRTLGEQNIAFIAMTCKMLRLERDFRYSSDYPTESKRSDRVMDILKRCGATRYYCAQGAFDYMLEDGVFPVSDIETVFQDFKPIPYKQVGMSEGFVHSLSIIDALMNIGPEKTAELVKNGTGTWLTWDEMLERRTARTTISKEGELNAGI